MNLNDIELDQKYHSISAESFAESQMKIVRFETLFTKRSLKCAENFSSKKDIFLKKSNTPQIIYYTKKDESELI